MPEHARGADYLYLHANVSRRISNLETGVHPVRSEGGETDSYGPETIPITGPFLDPAASGATDLALRWMRRMGIAQLIGGVQAPTFSTLAGMAASEVVGTLVPEGRPPIPLTLYGQLSESPYSFKYTVGTDGQITVFKPDGVAPGSTGVQFFLEGSSWGVT